MLDAPPLYLYRQRLRAKAKGYLVCSGHSHSHEFSRRQFQPAGEYVSRWHWRWVCHLRYTPTQRKSAHSDDSA